MQQMNVVEAASDPSAIVFMLIGIGLIASVTIGTNTICSAAT
ncbi:hypothetical protein [Paraburkholderia lacunae]|nr:hypothetical protein [Paraburkholderia lacunae]